MLYLDEAGVDVGDNPLYPGLRVQHKLGFSRRKSLPTIQLMELAHDVFTSAI